MKGIVTLSILLFLGMFVTSSYAYECTSMPQYLAGIENSYDYSSGIILKHSPLGLSLGNCAEEGIDLATVNTYPNWPRKDWQGNPDHANSGDIMCNKDTVYKANWWTSSIPGSDSSWTKVCTGICDSGGSSSGGNPDGYGPEMSQATIDKHEVARTNTPLFKLIKESIQTRDNAVVEAIAPGLANNPENVKRVESFINEAKWDYLFPMRNKSYTYTNFLRAIGKFKGFCTTFTDGRDSDAICRKSLATMFAHFTQETGGHDASSATLG